jgi:hypothetical protein
MVPFLYSDHWLLLSASTFADCCHFLNVTELRTRISYLSHCEVMTLFCNSRLARYSKSSHPILKGVMLVNRVIPRSCYCQLLLVFSVTLSHFVTQDITTKYPKPAELTKWLVTQNCKSDSLSTTFDLQPFSQNTSHPHDNLRRVSKSPLLHLFTCHRSGTLDWRVMRATSVDSSRLIHTILAHSSTLHYRSTLCHHRTSRYIPTNIVSSTGLLDKVLAQPLSKIMLETLDWGSL